MLLFGAAVLNYVDRQTLSTLAPTIQSDLGMDDRDYANIVNLFLVAYTLLAFAPFTVSVFPRVKALTKPLFLCTASVEVLVMGCFLWSLVTD